MHTLSIYIYSLYIYILLYIILTLYKYIYIYIFLHYIHVYMYSHVSQDADFSSLSQMDTFLGVRFGPLALLSQLNMFVIAETTPWRSYRAMQMK